MRKSEQSPTALRMTGECSRQSSVAPRCSPLNRRSRAREGSCAARPPTTTSLPGERGRTTPRNQPLRQGLLLNPPPCAVATTTPWPAVGEMPLCVAVAAFGDEEPQPLPPVHEKPRATWKNSMRSRESPVEIRSSSSRWLCTVLCFALTSRQQCRRPCHDLDDVTFREEASFLQDPLQCFLFSTLLLKFTSVCAPNPSCLPLA